MAKAKKKSVKPKVKKKTTSKPVKKVVKKVIKAKAKPKPKPKAAPQKAKASSSENAKKTSNWASVLTPLDDRVILEVSGQERRTPGGLIIPDTASVSGNFQGKVVVVGRGHRDNKGRLRPMDVKAGDTVVFSEFSGSKIEVMGTELKILRESEILGILDKQ